MNQCIFTWVLLKLMSCIVDLNVKISQESSCQCRSISSSSTDCSTSFDRKVFEQKRSGGSIMRDRSDEIDAKCFTNLEIPKVNFGTEAEDS